MQADSTLASTGAFHLRQDGFVLLESVIDPALLAALSDALLGLIDVHVDARNGGIAKGRYHLALNICEPFTSSAVVANPLVMPMLTEVLGDDLAISYFGSDSATRGSEYQPVHRDGRDLFPGTPIALPPVGIVVNVLLNDFTPDNGPVEIWPNSTHHLHDIDPVVGARNAEGLKVIAPAGSLLVRDLRVWHRGTPSHSDEIRSMIAVVYSRPWYRFGPVEAGHPEPAIGWADYSALDPQIRHLFRFAAIDPNLANFQSQLQVANGGRDDW